MSLLVWPMSKLTLTKKPVFSSCFSTKKPVYLSPPKLLLTTNIIAKNGLRVELYDPINKVMNKTLIIKDHSQTLGNFFEDLEPIGSSRGYLALRNEKDSSVHLVHFDNHRLKIITLPPLHFYEISIKNVSVSSPVNGDDDDDVIVAVKFSESRLSLCRAGDSEWTRIHVPSKFDSSSVVYSERDERFYLINDDEFETSRIDLTTSKSGLVTPVSGYPFPIDNITEFNKNMSPFPYSQYIEKLVESPSGQLFIVCWVTCNFNKKGEMVASSEWVDGYPMTKEKTQKIFVYKQDEDEEEEEICSYIVTKDIGDLCIFIGKNEPFCVCASDYPGLKPNSVYFAEGYSNIGVCDLSSQTILHFSENIRPYPYSYMFWIPPSYY